LGESWFKDEPGQKVIRHISHKKLGVVVHACHPSNMGSKNRRSVVQANQGISTTPYLKNNQSK
jgi:hypothetical protein